jgi:hypothetical protein
MAFARFFYNRICSATGGEYEVLPSLTTGISAIPEVTNVPGSAGRSTHVVEDSTDGIYMDTHEEGHNNADDEVSEPPLPISETVVSPLDRLCAAVTQDEDPSAIPKILLGEFATKRFDEYSKLESDAAKAEFLELAQFRNIKTALSHIQRSG